MNIKEAFNYTKKQLIKAGVDDPAFDTVYLFEHLFSMSRTDIAVHNDKEVSSIDFTRLNTMIERRASGEPVQYIIGQWYFMGNTFKVKKGVLIPRDDTQVLVDACIDIIKINNFKTIVDLCSGSGIIAITLKKLFANSTVYAVEKSDTAYSILKDNCQLNDADVKLIHSDLNDCCDKFNDGCVDLVVSNPPYIITDEINSLQKEVQFEPKMALDGGKDGYDFYRMIIKKWSQKLKRGGYIAFEIGEGQFEYISKLLLQNGFCDIKGFDDLSSTVRAMTAIYNP